MAKNLSRVRPQGLVIAHGLWRHGLSFKALGLLYLLLDLAELPDWDFSLQGLVAIAQQYGMGDGRDAIRTALAELEAKAFLVRQRQRDASGRLASSQWLISDSPITSAGQIPAPATASPTSENPTLVNRLQEGSSSNEEEEKQETSLKVPRASRDHAAFQQLWNSAAPGHWVQIRELGQQRCRRLNGLVREFGGLEPALAALAASLQQAHREEWCMKSSTKLSIENWLSNNKVRQYSEKASQAADPLAACLSGEQQEMAALAGQYPALFERLSVQDGILRLHYTPAVQRQASYPASAMVGSLEALGAEITHLQAVLTSGCPF